MPRDTSRSVPTPQLHRRATSPVSALAAFSALVAVSVALSTGVDPAADTVARGEGGSAFGAPASTAQRAVPGWSLLAAGQEQQRSSAEPGRDGRMSSPVRDGAAGDGAWREGAGRGDGGGHSASTVRPGRKAPRLYLGELPVNTIIAPASPGAVLPGGQFGWRIAPDRGGREFHNGTDVSASAGVPVVAALDGRVTAVFWDVWGGNRVEVSHDDGMRTTYSHLEDVRVEVGDRLAASERLGTVGATGVRVTGPHLHFETWVDGKAVDPQSFDWIDGQQVIPASRGKYSLEVPVPEDDVAPTAPREPSTADRPPKKKPVEKKPAEKVTAEEKLAKKEPAKKEPTRNEPAEQPASKDPADAEPTAERAPRTPAPAQEQPAAPPEAPKTTAPETTDPVRTAPVQTPPAPVTPAVPAAPAEPEAPPAEPVAPAPPVAPVEQVVPVEPVAPAPPAEPVVPAPPAEPAAPPQPVEPVKPADPPPPPVADPGVAPLVPDTVRDTDGDGILDVEDSDIDGDGIANELDDDLDGDGIPNDVDPDLDGDGLRNEVDADLDGDGLLNTEDEQPARPAPKAPTTAAAPQEPSGPATAPAAGDTTAAAASAG